MADVRITCNPNDPTEMITGYHFFQDDLDLGRTTTPEFLITSVEPGAHKYEVAAENVWGIGPKSDPVFSPGAASKCAGVQINIVINIGG
jgi:hypothetical protein